MEENREHKLLALVEKYGLEVSKKRRKNLMEVDDRAFASYKAGIEIAYACKKMDLDGGYEVYRYCKQENIPLSHNLYTNLLSLTAGLGDPGCGSLMRRVTPPKDYHKAMEIYATIKDLGIIPAEAAFSALIRCYCAEGHREEALSLYEDLKKAGLEAKLRGISPLVAAFGAAGDASTCFYLFDEMRNHWEMEPSEKEYYGLLQACAITKDSRFVSVVDEMMEDLLHLHNQETIDLIVTHLSIVYAFQHQISRVDSEGFFLQLQEECHLPVQLRSVDLNNDTRAGLLKQLTSFAIHRDPNQKHKLNNKVKDYVSHLPTSDPVASLDSNNTINNSSERAAESVANDSTVSADPTKALSEAREKKFIIPKANEEKWQAFTTWLDTRHVKNPFDVIVDGANVGYYKQNFAGAPTHIDYHQLHAVIESLLHEHGRCPILIIHSRHLAEHMLPQQHSDIQQIRQMIQSWRDRDIVYPTPKGFNDDWFWLYATVRFQVPVITNDEMRDHHFKLLSARYFMRWRERYRACYDLFFSNKRSQMHVVGEEEDDEEEIDEGEGSGVDSGNQQSNNTDLKEFSFCGNVKSRFSPNVHRNRAKFYFPRKYSFRMQHFIQSFTAAPEHNAGELEVFCLPPLAPKYDNNLVDPDAPRLDESTSGAGEGSALANGPKTTIAHSAREAPVHNENGSWVVLYKAR